MNIKETHQQREIILTGDRDYRAFTPWSLRRFVTTACGITIGA